MYISQKSTENDEKFDSLIEPTAVVSGVMMPWQQMTCKNYWNHA